MEAIIKTGGRQYRVKQGEKIIVNQLPAEQNAEVTFETLLVNDGKAVKTGQPLVEGASVTAKVLQHLRGEKVVAQTYKRRKGFHKKIGHRQSLTQVEITKIQG